MLGAGPVDVADPATAPGSARPRPSGRAEPLTLAAVGLGGAVGAPARHAMGLLLPWSGPGSGFPWATLLVNVTGSFALGCALVLVARWPGTHYLRPLVAVGFVGSYTTYSAFAVETVELFDHGRAGAGLGYALGTVGLGLVAAWLGAGLARASLRAEGAVP